MLCVLRRTTRLPMTLDDLEGRSSAVRHQWNVLECVASSCSSWSDYQRIMAYDKKKKDYWRSQTGTIKLQMTIEMVRDKDIVLMGNPMNRKSYPDYRWVKQSMTLSEWPSTANHIIIITALCPLLNCAAHTETAGHWCKHRMGFISFHLFADNIAIYKTDTVISRLQVTTGQ